MSRFQYFTEISCDTFKILYIIFNIIGLSHWCLETGYQRMRACKVYQPTTLFKLLACLWVINEIDTFDFCSQVFPQYQVGDLLGSQGYKCYPPPHRSLSNATLNQRYLSLPVKPNLHFLVVSTSMWSHYVISTMKRVWANWQGKCLLDPYMPNGISHPYQLDKSISSFRVVGWCFFFFFIFVQICTKHFLP